MAEKIIEGIYAYADGDCLCRYSEDLTPEQKDLISAIGVGRYVGLAEFSKDKGFLYSALGGAFLDGEKGDVEADYDFVSYASRPLGEAMLFEVHVLRKSVQDATFPRGTKELSHFLRVPKELGALAPNAFLKGPLTQENDLPAWTFNLREGAELPRVKNNPFAAVPFSMPSTDEGKNRCIAFTEAYVLSRKEGKPLLVAYPLAQKKEFEETLFNWLRFYPSAFGSAVSFLTAAAQNDGSDILGVPYGTSFDKAALEKVYGAHVLLDFALAPTYDLPLSALGELMRQCFEEPKVYKEFRLAYAKTQAPMDFDGLNALIDAFFLSRSSAKDASDIFGMAKLQGEFLDELAKSAKAFGAADKQKILKRLNEQNVGLSPEYGSLGSSIRFGLIDKAIKVHVSAKDGFLKLASIRHLDSLLLPPLSCEGSALNPYAEGLLHLISQPKEFLFGTYYPHLFLDTTQDKRVYALVTSGVSLPLNAFAASYISFLTSRLPDSKGPLLQYGRFLRDKEGDEAFVSALFATHEANEAERLALAVEFLKDVDAKESKVIRGAIFAHYAGVGGIKRLLEGLETLPDSSEKEEMAAAALRSLLHLEGNKDVKTLQSSIAELEGLSIRVAEARKMVREALLFSEFFASAEVLSEEDFNAYGSDALLAAEEFLHQENEGVSAGKLRDIWDDLYHRYVGSSVDANKVYDLEKDRLSFSCKMLRTLPPRDIRRILTRHLGKRGFKEAYDSIKGIPERRLDQIVLAIESGNIRLQDLNQWWEFGRDVYEAKGKKRFNAANLFYAFRNGFFAVLTAVITLLYALLLSVPLYIFVAHNTYYLLFLGLAVLSGLAGFGIATANCRDANTRRRIVVFSLLESFGVATLLLGAFVAVFVLVH